jgi:hypothetical protein
MKRLALLALVLAATAGRAVAAETAPTEFALIIGVNQSGNASQAPLRYADDDAARYRDIFHAVGARTYLLTTLDENTRRLHPEAAAEAMPARDKQLTATVAKLTADVEKAQRSGYVTTLYVIYAGHGEVEGETGYVNLEDGRLTGPALATRVLNRVRADRSHVIVDACSSFYFALGRGSSGQRRPLHGFSQLGGALVEQRDIGLLLSTSSARESHEWAAFQAGVFSHEVRSGMFGAADADGNGIVSYAEMAAFIKRANQSIPNEKYRPEVFWRPPRGSTALVDLRSALDRRVEIDPDDNGHYYLEDPRGVRLADFHNGHRYGVRLLRPAAASADRLYLHRTRDDREIVLPATLGVLRTSELKAEEPHVSVRSAAHEAFSAIFALPFDQATVEEVLSRQEGLLAAPIEAPPPEPPTGNRRVLGLTMLTVAAVAAAGGTWAYVSARGMHEDIGPMTSQQEATATNDGIRTRNRLSGTAFGLAGVAALAGTLLWSWPEERTASGSVSVSVSPFAAGGLLDLRGRF